MMQDIDSKLKSIIISNLRYKVDDDAISDDMNIVKTFRIDSLQLAKLFVDIEGEFGIKFDNLGEIVSILARYGDLRDYILDKLPK